MVDATRCTACDGELSPGARFCPRCGAAVASQSRRDQHPATTGQHDASEPPAPAPTFTPGRVAAMVATFVVLTVLGTWMLSQLFGSTSNGAPDPTTAATSGSTGSPSPSASRSGSAPADAAPKPRLADAPQRCSTSGSDQVATTWSGNRDTSCAFSDAVRAAYRKAGAPDSPQPFRTYSTVTKKWYDVTCLATEATPPVRCHSADGNAVVFLGP